MDFRDDDAETHDGEDEIEQPDAESGNSSRLVEVVVPDSVDFDFLYVLAVVENLREESCMVVDIVEADPIAEAPCFTHTFGTLRTPILAAWSFSFAHQSVRLLLFFAMTQSTRAWKTIGKSSGTGVGRSWLRCSLNLGQKGEAGVQSRGSSGSI